MKPVAVASWNDLEDRKPVAAFVSDVDLVIVRFDDNHSVLYGRCQHRGALMADGYIDGDNILCGVHKWDFGYRTGISEYDNSERLHKFSSWVEDDQLFVDADEVAAWAIENPQPYDLDAYQGKYQDHHGSADEPHVQLIRQLANDGLSKLGHHGPVGAMGVSRNDVPKWDDIQVVTAQLARRPLLDDAQVATETVIGPNAKKPLRLDIPLFVSDMSFGALSEEAKISLSKGAELAGTGICSGEGGMLPEEKAENSRYFYELASGKFGWDVSKVADVGAFHFKFGQGAKTGTGGHLPGNKVVGKIAEVRGLAEGQDAVSPATFPDLTEPEHYRELIEEVRSVSGGVPIGAKLSAQHIEADIDAAIDLGVDYIILDGRGGGTGAAPKVFRDHISIPTIPALARARHHLDKLGSNVTLVITGGLRTHTDFFKAMALGADAVALSNAPMQAIGCIGMRACNTDACPVGIATQRQDLRSRLIIDDAAQRLARWFGASVELMEVLARATGHDRLSDLSPTDLTTFDRSMADLTGIRFGGVLGS